MEQDRTTQQWDITRWAGHENMPDRTELRQDMSTEQGQDIRMQDRTIIDHYITAVRQHRACMYKYRIEQVQDRTGTAHKQVKHYRLLLHGCGRTLGSHGGS